jgi:hypothetical protein
VRSSHLPAVVTTMLCCDSHTLSFKGQGLQAAETLQRMVLTYPAAGLSCMTCTPPAKPMQAAAQRMRM